MKRILTLCLAILLAASLTACSSSGGGQPEPSAPSAAAPESATDAPAPATPEPAAPAGEEGPYIILVNALVGHPVYEQQAVGARQAAEDYGVKLEIIGPTLGSNAMVEETNNFIDNAITLRPDAIITEPWDPSMNAAMQRIYDAGIPNFCTSNLPENEEHFVAWIGTDNYNYGITAADMIAEKTGGAANVCIMMGSLETTNQVEQKNGFEDRIAEAYPDIKVAVTEADGNDMAKAITKFEEVFQAYPEVDVVWMLEGTGGPAAAQVAQEMNREVLILDIDAVEQTIDLIKGGQIWATLAQNFYKRGYESVRMAVEYLENGNADSFDKINDSGVVLINSDNVDKYEEDLMAAIRYKGTPLK